MIAIKDMKEAPSSCDRCELFPVCKHRDVYNENYKPNDCSLVEIVTCENCNNHGINKEHPDIDGARYCSVLHTYTGYDFYCGNGERKR